MCFQVTALAITMVGDSRPRTETRMAGAVFTVPRVMKAPGGIETVATVT